MPYVTLSTLQRTVVSRYRGKFTKSINSVDLEQVNEYLTEAYVQLQDEGDIFRKLHPFNTVAGRFYHDAPSDLLNEKILPDSMEVLNTTGDPRPCYPTYRTWRTMLGLYGRFENPSNNSGPSDWSLSGHDFVTSGGTGRQIILAWPPLNSITNGGRCHYVPHPGILNRTYDQSSVTATFTNGDATVLFSGAIAAGTYQVGDAIGLKSSATALPSKWYRVTEITDTTHCQVSPVYAEATSAGSLFTISQVSPVEEWRPGLVRTAAAEYALWMLYELDEGTQSAAYYMNRWNSEKDRVISRVENTGDKVFEEIPEARRYAAYGR
jgi:hypothetical protein